MSDTAAKTSVFSGVSMAPPDPILGLTLAYKADPSPTKVDLGVGAYRTEEGKPLVLNVVKKVEQKLLQDGVNKEYLPIDGLPEFIRATAQLIFGADCPALREGRIATCQSISGTGALRIGAEFIHQYMPNAPVYLPNPTWGNHNSILARAQIKDVRTYRYFDKKTNGLDMEGFLADLQAAPSGSVILLHACAHNPTGVDPTPEQWSRIADVMQAKGLFPFFDSAYQGFATGDLDADAGAVRMFVARGFELFCTQSYAKNFGLYSERIGAINVVCSTDEIAKRVLSQLKLIVRPMYSNPPAHGARIVAEVLTNRPLFEEWLIELRGMSERIKAMRRALYDALVARGTPSPSGDWSHILKQIGMFTFTGLNEAQSKAMIDRHHIYLLSNGRISMPGLNTKNIDYVANAIHDVITRP